MMAKTRASPKSKDDQIEILKSLLIVQLGVAGVPQKAIRQIVGCDMNHVSRILKYVKTRQTKVNMGGRLKRAKTYEG
jgi:hypothetical protein